MKRIRTRPDSRLHKLSQRGFRGYPVATIALYGPTAERASKVAVGIFLQESRDPDFLQRWLSEDEETDVRHDPTVEHEVLAFIREHGVRSVVMTNRLLGCPHEEGVDYPEGQKCPQCPYWASRDRFTHEQIQ